MMKKVSLKKLKKIKKLTNLSKITKKIQFKNKSKMKRNKNLK